MTTATFFNFDTKPFTGHWDGKPKTFAPGAKVRMPAWLAEHFAKHLANRYLIENGKETYTSPKNPAQAPEFMEVFRRAYIADLPSSKSAESAIDDIIASAEEPSMDIVIEKPKDLGMGPAAVMEAEDTAAAPQESAEAFEDITPADDDDFESPGNVPATPIQVVGL